MGVIECDDYLTLTILRNDRAPFFYLARKQVLPRLEDSLLLHVRRSPLKSLGFRVRANGGKHEVPN